MRTLTVQRDKRWARSCNNVETQLGALEHGGRRDVTAHRDSCVYLFWLQGREQPLLITIQRHVDNSSLITTQQAADKATGYVQPAIVRFHT